MLHLPDPFARVLQSYVKASYYKNTRKADFAKRAFTEGDYRFFMKGVAQLSVYFTADRANLPKNYFNQKELRSGYLLYFLPINALKIAALLKQIPPDFFKSPRSVLDIGSGPGTGAIGTLLHLGAGEPKQRLHITLLDQNKHIMTDGANLIRSMVDAKLCAKPEQLNMIHCDLARDLNQKLPRQQQYDLVLMANVLNEIRDLNRRAKLINQLVQKHLTPDGRLIIVEPALRRQTRELMELRDMIADREIAFIDAPCLHQEACPMFAHNTRDWCHMYWEWERPEFIEHLDDLVGIHKDYLKASYLILSALPSLQRRGLRGGQTRPLPHPPLSKGREHIWRVVSGPLNSKGKSERLLCGPSGLPHLHRLMRLDRNRSKTNQDFDRAMRGDLVVTEAKDKLGKQDSFRLSGDGL